MRARFIQFQLRYVPFHTQGFCQEPPILSRRAHDGSKEPPKCIDKNICEKHVYENFCHVEYLKSICKLFFGPRRWKPISLRLLFLEASWRPPGDLGNIDLSRGLRGHVINPLFFRLSLERPPWVGFGLVNPENRTF